VGHSLKQDSPYSKARQTALQGSPVLVRPKSHPNLRRDTTSFRAVQLSLRAHSKDRLLTSLFGGDLRTGFSAKNTGFGIASLSLHSPGIATPVSDEHANGLEIRLTLGKSSERRFAADESAKRPSFGNGPLTVRLDDVVLRSINGEQPLTCFFKGNEKGHS